MSGFAYRGRWGLVTGASAGLGEVFAHALAGRGMHLVLAARREERLHALARDLSRVHGVEAVAVPADLGDPDGARRLWRSASEGREIHLLVNNAGFGARGRFDGLPRDRQAEMVAVNCTAPLELAHLAAGGMRRRGEGGIVNVASIAGFFPIPTQASYGATKAFLLSLSEALREEMRGSGVRVVTLCPGPVRTEFQEVAGTHLGPGAPGVVPPETVVAAALRSLERGGGRVIPGRVNRLMTGIGQLLPQGLVLRTARTIIRRFR
jgi:uncharacterized protein